MNGFCMQMTKRYARMSLSHDKAEGRPQGLFSRDGQPLSYDEADEYLRSLPTDLVPCRHADESGRCQGFEFGKENM